MISKDKFELEIQNIVYQLVNLYKPEKVILFGSLASGNINEGSDIDFLIIKEEVPQFGVDRIRQLELMVKYKLATDFIVYKPNEIKERIELGDPFINNVLKQGKVLYERK